MTAPPPSVNDPSTTIGHLIDHGAYQDAIVSAADHYGPLIGRYCLALLSAPGEAQEACQETFLAAYANLAHFNDQVSFKAWILGLARQVCARRLEGEASPPCGPPHSTPSQTQLQGALNRLRPSEREALVLRFALNVGYDDIAGASGVDESTAQKRASRGLNRLRQLLAEEGTP